jgi:hypothetical protein
MTSDLYLKSTKELFANRPSGDTVGSFSSAGTLENVTQVSAVVLEPTSKVGMPGPRSADTAWIRVSRWYIAAFRYGATLFLLCRGPFRTHDMLPVWPIFIFDKVSDRATQCLTVTHTANNASLIVFYLHPFASAVTAHSALQISVDLSYINRQTSR